MAPLERPTRQDLAQALHHLMYDLEQLFAVHDRLAARRDEDRQITRSMTVSIAVLTRTLIKFVAGDRASTSALSTREDDILAVDYRPYITNQGLAKAFPITFSERLGYLHKAAGEEVAHLGVNRIRRRDDDRSHRKARWGESNALVDLVEPVCLMLVDPGIRSLYGEARFEAVPRPRSIERAAILSRSFVTRARNKGSLGTESGSLLSSTYDHPE